MALSRRAFFLSAASVPVIHEGLLAALAAGPVPETAPQPVVRLSSNENPYGPCQGAREAIARATPQACRYPYAGMSNLVERLARLHDLPPDMVVLGNGSSEILYMAAAAFLSPQKASVTAELTYEAPWDYAERLGAPVKKAPLTGKDFRHDTRKMAIEGAGLIYVCNPNNPTASLTPKQDLAALVAALPSGAVLLVDEAYYHFVEAPEYESALRYVAAGKDVVVARTFSKIYGLAGARIGYAVARKELAQRMRRQAMHNNMNALGLEAAMASLEDTELEARNRDRNAAARRLLTDWCDRNHTRYAPTHANFVFFHIGRRVEPVIDALRARGVLVGRPFPPFTDWMRVSVGTEEEMRRFLREYENLKA